MTDDSDMTDDQDTAQWRSEELHPVRGFRLPWLALAGVVATVVAATTLVIGIGDSLGDDRPPGRLLPLQAASPPTPTPAPEDTPGDGPEDDAPTETPEPSEPPEPSLQETLLKLRFAVDEGVEEGDVRNDVGIDLTNVIERILDRPWSPPESRREDVAYLHQKIATRAREGAIDGDRAHELHTILDRAE